jgi:transposase InsO family protein
VETPTRSAAIAEMNFSRSASAVLSPTGTTMESFFSSLKTERLARKTYRTRNQARQDVFDYIERFYNLTRRHSTLGYLSPMDFEKQANVA